jgi:hypothetical protein
MSRYRIGAPENDHVRAVLDLAQRGRDSTCSLKSECACGGDPAVARVNHGSHAICELDRGGDGLICRSVEPKNDGRFRAAKQARCLLRRLNFICGLSRNEGGGHYGLL